MKSLSVSKLATALLFGCSLLAQTAQADTQSVFYNHLESTAVVATPLAVDDTLFVDTFTTERGALRQVTTFTVGPSVHAFSGNAAWLVNTASGAGPRLTRVDIDLFDMSHTLVHSDSFAGVLAGFAHSTFSGLLGPGTYTLVATGTGVRDSSLDISLVMAVPEPEFYAMLLTGLGVIGLGLRRRLAADKSDLFPQVQV